MTVINAMTWMCPMRKRSTVSWTSSAGPRPTSGSCGGMVALYFKRITFIWRVSQDSTRGRRESRSWPCVCCLHYNITMSVRGLTIHGEKQEGKESRLFPLFVIVCVRYSIFRCLPKKRNTCLPSLAIVSLPKQC